MEQCVNIKINNFAKAKDGSLLIKRDGHWETTTFEELNELNKKKLEQVDALKRDFETLARANKHFVTYAKSHFIVVFNSFKLKATLGEIEIEDDALLNLDELVLKGEVTVKDAIEKHPYLKETFTALYLGTEEIKTYPQD